MKPPLLPHVGKRTLFFQQKILHPSLVEFVQVPVVLENKFSCKVETWFYSDIGHSLHAFRIPTSQS